MTTQSQAAIGIDVSKDWCDVAHTDSRCTQRFATNPTGLCQLIDWCDQHPAQWIIMEATGGYERPILQALHAQQLPALCVNPRQTRAFAKAQGQLAKTDALDALSLAQYGLAMKPPLRTIPCERDYQLKAWLRRRHQLITMRVQEKTRYKRCDDPIIRGLVQTNIQHIDAQIQQVDEQLLDLITDHEPWLCQYQRLNTIPGVGKATALEMVAGLPELGSLGRGKIAALVGVAPLNRDSGQRRGEATTYGGRKAVRCALYMATLSATRCNPIIKPYYQKLKARGKPPKVALVAAMRKLLIIINTMTQNQTSWEA